MPLTCLVRPLIQKERLFDLPTQMPSTSLRRSISAQRKDR